MRNRISLSNQESGDTRGTNQLNVLYNSTSQIFLEDKYGVIYTSEEQEILADYARRLCIGRESEMIVLSSNRHYYYDSEEMKKVRVVTSLKELNKISDLKSFLQSLYTCLQPKTFFLGHFTNNSNATGYFQAIENQQRIIGQKDEEIENGIRSRYALLNKIYNLLDAKAFNNLSRRTVELYLHNCGFRVIDMTIIKMTTCFCAQRLPSVEK